MIRRAVLALISVLLLASPALADPELPALDAQGMTAPLRPDQLDAAERATYAGLAPGSDEARQFLYTRGFLRYARRVVDGRMPAADLPPLPARANWKRAFLSQHEATEVLDVALTMRMQPVIDRLRPPEPVTVSSPDLPGVGPDGKSLALRIGQLDAAERQAYARLDPASDDARQFLYTRGFLRYAKLVVEEKMAPISLPGLPARADWDRQFLSEHEAKSIVDVALGLSVIAMMGPAN